MTESTSPPSSPRPPRRTTVRLRRGVTVGARDAGLLVVGADPAHHVVLPDTTVVHQVLVQLRQGLPRGALTGTGEAVADALERAGLLVDVEEQALLAAARASTRVGVVAPAAWRGRATALLELAGMAIASRRDGSDIDLTWVITVGAPSWATHDDLVARDEPALFTSVLPSRVRVGPFVVPGVTACLRCLDAQAPGLRPASDAEAPLALPEDLPPLLLERALTWAVDDLCAWAEGRQPSTWSATSWMSGLHDVEPQRWQQHPHCGCCWDQAMTG